MESTEYMQLLGNNEFVSNITNCLRKHQQLKQAIDSDKFSSNTQNLIEEIESLNIWLNDQLLDSLNTFRIENIKKFKIKLPVFSKFEEIIAPLLKIKTLKQNAVNAQNYELASTYRTEEKNMLNDSKIGAMVNFANSYFSKKLLHSNNAYEYYVIGFVSLHFFKQFHEKHYTIMLENLKIIAQKQLLAEITMDLKLCSLEEYNQLVYAIKEKKVNWLNKVLVK
jgi:hypothetical protein